MQPTTSKAAAGEGATVAAEVASGAAVASGFTVSGGATLAADATTPTRALDGEGALPGQIGRFRVLQRLGAGGMGVVFAGYDVELDRKVAIKLLLVDRGEGSIGRGRMMREAQAMARLSHPNVIQIYEVGAYAGQIFLAMEFVAGPTLEAWQSARRRPWRELLAMYVQAARGLAAAHAAGIIHRDFKPDNALVDEAGTLRVLDFGLATRGGEAASPTTSEPAAASDLLISALDRSLTHVGAVMGTPAYMSPEQALGAAIDARTDQFSLCVALWEALYGQRPFAGASLPELSLNLSAGTIVAPPRRSGVPRWLHRALLRGLQVDPDRRWPDLPALISELSLGPGRTRRRLLAAAGLVAAIGVGFGLTRDGAAPCDGAPRLRGVWDDEARAAVTAAAAASGLPFARDASERTVAALDDHAAAWVVGHDEACLAHRRGEQSDALLDLRMRCLEQRLDELGEAASLLRQADAGVVERGPQIAVGLGSLAACADTEALGAAIAPPRDAAAVAQVDALRRVLTRSKTLESAARYAEATALAQEVVTAAAPLAYPPLLAEATARLGRLSNRTGKFALAVSQLEDAYYLALAARHDSVAGDAAVRLVRLYGDRLGDEAQGQRWRRSAGAFVARVGPDSQLAAGLHGSLGTVHMKYGRHEAARADFEAMVAIFERDEASNPEDLANALSNLGATLEALGRLDEAEARLTRALELRERMFGPQHPNTAMTLGNLANVYGRRDDWARARAANERVLAVFERSLGPEHANTAMVRANLARCLAHLRDPGARAAYEESVALFVTVFGEESPMLAELRREYETWLATGVPAKE